MTVGGDGYTSLTRMIEPITREQLWEAAANYVKSLGTVNPQTEGRIIAAQAGQAVPTPPAAATPALPTPSSVLPTAVPGAGGSAGATPTAGPVPGMPTTGAGDSGVWILPLLASALFAVLGGMLLLRRKASR
jgi:hypothetical protein